MKFAIPLAFVVSVASAALGVAVNPPVRVSAHKIDRSTIAGPTTRGSGGGWPTLSPEQQAAAVKELKAFGEKVRQEEHPSLGLYETKYFLFYSDMRPDDARRWASVLDAMYAKLSELFAIPKDTNIWRGKGEVFVFALKEDFTKFEKNQF